MNSPRIPRRRITASDLHAKYKKGERDFRNSILIFENLSDSHLTDIDLSNSEIFMTSFQNANLQNANLSECVFGTKKWAFSDRWGPRFVAFMCSDWRMQALLGMVCGLVIFFLIGDKINIKDLMEHLSKHPRAFTASTFASFFLSIAITGRFASAAALRVQRIIFKIASRFRMCSNLSGANLTDVNLTRSMVWGVDFSGATFCRTRIMQCDGFESSDLSGTNIQSDVIVRLGITLDGRNQDFSDQSLYAISLRDAKLSGANLERCDLLEADLANADLTNASLGSAFVDTRTFKHSKWSEDDVISAWNLGIEIRKIYLLSEQMRIRLLSRQEGLTLVLDAHLLPSDRFLLDILSLATAGTESDCRIEEFRNFSDRKGALVRFVASKRHDLERVADAIIRRIWEQDTDSQKSEDATIATNRHVSTLLLDTVQIKNMITKLVSSIESITMRELLSARDSNAVDAGTVSENTTIESACRPELAGIVWQGKYLFPSPPHESYDTSLALGPSRKELCYDIEEPFRVLILNAKEDDELAERLSKRLTPLTRSTSEKRGLIEIVNIANLRSIADQNEIISESNPDVALAIVSRSFLNDHETVRLYDSLHSYLIKNRQPVFVVLREALDTINITERQEVHVLPEGGVPISGWPTLDAALRNISQSLEFNLRNHIRTELRHRVEKQEIRVHVNIVTLLDRLDSALERGDYPAVLHASASIIETAVKDKYRHEPGIQDQGFGGFIDKLKADPRNPKEIVEFMHRVYKQRNTDPLAGHGSILKPLITKEEAIILKEFTLAMVKAQYQIQSSSSLNQVHRGNAKIGPEASAVKKQDGTEGAVAVVATAEGDNGTVAPHEGGATDSVAEKNRIVSGEP